jgi:hypothetical protein
MSPLASVRRLRRQLVWSFSRRCVAVISRHSDRTAERPRLWKRSTPRLNLVLANTGSITPLAFAVTITVELGVKHATHERMEASVSPGRAPWVTRVGRDSGPGCRARRSAASAPHANSRPSATSTPGVSVTVSGRGWPVATDLQAPHTDGILLREAGRLYPVHWPLNLLRNARVHGAILKGAAGHDETPAYSAR